jgi:hypothetical protein
MMAGCSIGDLLGLKECLKYRILLFLLGLMITALFLAAMDPKCAWAGPPFVTDDPEPVEYKHWEFYVASMYAKDKDERSGTAPHFEINYGVWPNVQLHMIAPFVYVKPNDGSSQYGFGAKVRLVQETDSIPMVGVFPLIEVPTGDSSRGLGNGRAQIFLPVWIQKSWGPWTTYGGGGYWRNPGAGNKDYWFLGWEGQRDLSEKLTIGAEAFYKTASTEEGTYSLGFNVGAIVNFTDEHHFIFSAGRGLHGENLFSAYAAYLWTFGPPTKKQAKNKCGIKSCEAFLDGTRIK